MKPMLCVAFGDRIMSAISSMAEYHGYVGYISVSHTIQ